jgi:hypothetical protein
MTEYTIRQATIGDATVIAGHRVRMFSEMGQVPTAALSAVLLATSAMLGHLDASSAKPDGPSFLYTAAREYDASAWLAGRERFPERGEAGKCNMADARRGGKTVPLCHKEPVSGDA